MLKGRGRCCTVIFCYFLGLIFMQKFDGGDCILFIVILSIYTSMSFSRVTHHQACFMKEVKGHFYLVTFYLNTVYNLSV